MPLVLLFTLTNQNGNWLKLAFDTNIGFHQQFTRFDLTFNLKTWLGCWINDGRATD